MSSFASPRSNGRAAYQHTDTADDVADCDPSYQGVCIPSGPGDLDCADVPYKSFRVVGTDPHAFDADRDGIGCEPWPR